MKVFTVHITYLEEEDFGGYQRHIELEKVFLNKERAEDFIKDNPLNNESYPNDPEYIIREWDVDE